MVKRVIAGTTVALVALLGAAATAQAQVAGPAAHVKVTDAHQAVRLVRTKQGQITGYGDKCLDDSGASTANGNKIDVWSCNNTDAQLWTFSGHALSVLGKCLDDASQGGAGAKLVLWSCNSHKAQTWSRFSNGEYRIGLLHRLCLTDPNDSTANGTQVELQTCKDSADQQWSKP